jgi:hypothetical protein
MFAPAYFAVAKNACPDHSLPPPSNAMVAGSGNADFVSSFGEQ